MPTRDGRLSTRILDLVRLLRRSRKREDVDSLRLKIERFRNLLTHNNRVMELIASAGESMGGDLLFDSQYLHALADELEESVQKVVMELNFITGNRYLALMTAFERTRAKVHRALQSKRSVPDTALVLPLNRIDFDLSDAVGEKMARLGEIRARLKVHTPDGFVITTRACQRFFDDTGLTEEARETMDAFLNKSLPAEEAESRMMRLISTADLPRDITREIREASQSLGERTGGESLFAVRSSAIGEDGELSFAGLHDSFLGAKPADLTVFYKRVLSSLFSARALVYRRAALEKSPELPLMAVGFLRMIAAKTGGVVYTLDPNDPEQAVLIVSAAPGLGNMVVEGKGNTDRFVVSRTPPYEVIRKEMAEKKEMYEVPPEGGIRLVQVPEENRNAAALSESFLSGLANTALRIEQYMKSAQDIEWAQDEDGRLFILQSRPLQIPAGVAGISREAREGIGRYKVLLSNRGTIGCRGVGYGVAAVIKEEERARDLPENYVLVAHQALPHLAELVPRASAVLTDIGASTGHLATITREFRVPSIVDCGIATEMVKDGMEITVDAEENVIYEGKVEELLRYQALRSSGFERFREFRALRRMLREIAPLHLSDPRARNFSPQACESYHDIIRFAHEKAVDYLLEGHEVSPPDRNGYCRHVEMNVPLDLMVIDIGEGLSFRKAASNCAIEDIRCEPLRALLEGLTSPGAWSTEPRGMDLSSFMSSATGPSVITAAPGRTERNLAIVSREYLNLNLHLGYHINQIDAFVSGTRNDNYIYFRFVGGMTDITRRSRRARMISMILQKQDFMVEVKGDFVVGRLKKFERRTMLEKLRIMGQLIGFTRQMDVLMREDSMVDKGVDDFVKTIYSENRPG